MMNYDWYQKTSQLANSGIQTFLSFGVSCQEAVDALRNWGISKDFLLDTLLKEQMSKVVQDALDRKAPLHEIEASTLDVYHRFKIALHE